MRVRPHDRGRGGRSCWNRPSASVGRGTLSVMRLKRGVTVAGVEPELARTLARACCRDWTGTAVVAERVKLPAAEVVAMLGQLADADYLERRNATWPGEIDDEWTTTIGGGALTMASFLKPMPRARADELLAGVLERVGVYNAEVTKPLLITEIAVFGSYLRPEVVELGDLDLRVTFAPREPDSELSEALLAFARASGRSFPSFMDELFWAEKEMKQVLRNRSGYISLHTEDISRFTDDWQVVYSQS